MFKPTVRRPSGAAAEKTTPRVSNRHVVTKSATINIDGADSIIPCTIRDLHDKGARLSVANIGSVPDKFLLAVRSENLFAKSQVAWRSHIELGVRFVRTGDQLDEEKFRKDQAFVFQKEQEKIRKAEEAIQREKSAQNAAAQLEARQKTLERERQLQRLGLDPRKPFSVNELKRAYRQQAMLKHPDHGGSMEEFMELNATYHMLLNSLSPSIEATPTISL